MSDKRYGIGFMDLVKYVTYVPNLITVVMASVAMVEAVKTGATGPEKKAAVLESIKLMWDKMAVDFKITASYESLVPLISLLIDLAVTIYNIFWKQTPVPVA